MAKTKTSAAVKNRYAAKAYDSLRILVPKGHKSTVQAAAEAEGESLNGYTNKALLARMGMNGWPMKWTYEFDTTLGGAPLGAEHIVLSGIYPHTMCPDDVASALLESQGYDKDIIFPNGKLRMESINLRS